MKNRASNEFERSELDKKNMLLFSFVLLSFLSYTSAVPLVGDADFLR